MHDFAVFSSLKKVLIYVEIQIEVIKAVVVPVATWGVC
jgi:hypothetical protein